MSKLVALVAVLALGRVWASQSGLPVLVFADKCLNRAYGAGVVQYLSSKTYPFIR